MVDLTRTADRPPMPEATADFLARHYYGPSNDAFDGDQSWRRIDDDWRLGRRVGASTRFGNEQYQPSAGDGAGRQVCVLFPADAQVGSWLSWQNVRWTLDRDVKVTGIS